MNTVAYCVNFQRDAGAKYRKYQKYVQNCFDNCVLRRDGEEMDHG